MVVAVATKTKAKAPAKTKAPASKTATGEVVVEQAEKKGTAREDSVPAPKGAQDVTDFSVEIVDNAHAVLTVNGSKYRLGQSDVSDARKALDAAYMELH